MIKAAAMKAGVGGGYDADETGVCVCIVLVHYGPFPQEVNEKSVKLAV